MKCRPNDADKKAVVDEVEQLHLNDGMRYLRDGIAKVQTLEKLLNLLGAVEKIILELKGIRRHALADDYSRQRGKEAAEAGGQQWTEVRLIDDVVGEAFVLSGQRQTEQQCISGLLTDGAFSVDKLYQQEEDGKGKGATITEKKITISTGGGGGDRRKRTRGFLVGENGTAVHWPAPVAI